MFPFKDISENQGVYDMSANTDPIIAIRMSTGVLNRFDEQATRNYNNASKAGKIIIQYHYCGKGDPTAEADLFISACKPFAQFDCYAIDAELGQSQAWKQTFVAAVHAATGCWPLNYMNISTANDLGALPNCGTWLAAPSWGFTQTITELKVGLVYVAQQGPIVGGVDTDMFFAPSLEDVKKYGFNYQPPAAAPLPQAPVPAPVVTAAPTPPPPPTVLPTLVNNVPSPTPVTPPAENPVSVTPTPASGQGTVNPTPVTAPVNTSVISTTELSFWQKLLQWVKNLLHF